MARVNCPCGYVRGGIAVRVGARVKCPQCSNPVVVEAGGEGEKKTQRVMRPTSSSRLPAVAPPPKGGVMGLVLACAGGGALVAAVLLVLVGGRSSPPPKPADEKDSGIEERIASLEDSLKSREGDLDRVRADLADAERRHQDALKRKEAEAEVLRRDIETAEARGRDLETQLADARAATSEPTTPVEQPAEQPAIPPSVADLYAKVRHSVAIVQTDRGFGTGFVITPEGLIVTNYHVISGARTISVRVAASQGGGIGEGYQFAAKALAIDDVNDLAILEVTRSGRGLQFIPAVLELSRPARTGEKAVIVGNPGMGTTMLDHTVTEGLVSSAAREIDGRPLIQTSAPVNPGNSGGPMFSEDGKVIGVVVAKATELENTGFAIPVELAKALFDERQGKFHVAGTLAEWEKNRAPKTSFNVDTSEAIAIGSNLTDIVIDEKAGYLYAIDWDQNSLAFINLAERKVEDSVYLGSEPTDLYLSSDGDLYVANSMSRTIVQVDLESKKIKKTIEVEESPLRVCHAKSVGVAYLNSSGQLRIVEGSGKETKCGLAVQDIDFDSGGRRLIAASYNAVVEIDIGDYLKATKRLAGATGTKPDDYKLRMEIQKDITEATKAHTIPVYESGNSYGYGRSTSLWVDSKHKRIYAGKTVLDAKRLQSTLGVFKPNPYSRSGDEAVRWFMQRYPELDNVYAVSPDGKWVSTGTHIYNAEKFSVHQELPVPSVAMAFNADSTVLWLFDLTNQAIIPVKVKAE